MPSGHKATQCEAGDDIQRPAGPTYTRLTAMSAANTTATLASL